MPDSLQQPEEQRKDCGSRLKTLKTHLLFNNELLSLLFLNIPQVTLFTRSQVLLGHVLLILLSITLYLKFFEDLDDLSFIAWRAAVLAIIAFFPLRLLSNLAYCLDQVHASQEDDQAVRY